MKKAIIFVIIAVIIGLIFLSASLVSQNEDSEEEENAEDLVAEPPGRNLSINLDEKMGFTAP